MRYILPPKCRYLRRYILMVIVMRTMAMRMRMRNRKRVQFNKEDH